MTVAELIEKLQKYDGNADIQLIANHNEDDPYGIYHIDEHDLCLKEDEVETVVNLWLV